MSPLNPIAWWLFLLAVPIVLFYILKIRLRQEPVSTTIFWQQVFEERRSRSFWRQLRHLISLLLSLAFLGLLVSAVLDFVPDSQRKPARCVVIVDNSAGMNARSPSSSRSRLEQAKAELQRLLGTTEVARQTAVLTAGGQPRIVVGFTDHLGTLRRGVEAIPTTDYPTALGETIELARQLVVGEEDSTILVYTATGLPETTDIPTDGVFFFPVGEPLDNMGITRFQPRRSLGDAVGYEVLAEVIHYGEKPARAELEIELGDRVVDVIPLTLEPGVPQTRIIRDATPLGGLLRARLNPVEGAPADPFPVDNEARAFLAERQTQRILVCGEEDFFLRKVLESQPNVTLLFPSEIPAVVPDDAVLVLHRTVPERIPRGNVLIVDPRSGCDMFDLGSPLAEMQIPPIVAKEDGESPLMKFVHLLNLTVRGARSLVPKEPEGKSGFTVLAETPEASPIFVHWQQPERSVVLLTADLTQGDLALRTAFPIMVSQALQQFRGSGGELEKAYDTREPVRLALKTDRGEVVLVSPSGFRQIFPVESGQVSLGTLPECGVWQILEPGQNAQDSEPVLVRIACNLASTEESNLRRAPENFHVQSHDVAALRTGVRPIWFWLALFALGMTTLEWFLYQRRWVD